MRFCKSESLQRKVVYSENRWQRGVSQAMNGKKREKKAGKCMRFSVVIPVYNAEQYLSCCVNSIQTQDFKDFEIILVDDGSTDGSRKLCDELAQNDGRIRVFHKENGGLSDARNVGVEKAEGEYILFVDSDDYISPNAFCEIDRVIQRNNEPELICLECKKVYEDSEKTVPMNDGISEEINELRGDELCRYFGTRNKYPASACTKAIRRVFFLKNELFFEKGRLSEDLEWATRLFTAVKSAAYCPVAYYNYRQDRAGSISTDLSGENYLHICDTIEKAETLAKQQSNRAKKQMLYSFMEYMFRFLLIGERQISKEKKKKYRQDVKHFSYVLGTRKDKKSRLTAMLYRCCGACISGRVLEAHLSLHKHA